MFSSNTNPFFSEDSESLENQLTQEFDFRQDAVEDLLSQLKQDNALVNVHSGLGEAGRDLLNPSSVSISAVNLTPWQRTRWRHNSFIFGNLVEILPSAMVMKFITYSCSDSNSLSSESQAKLEQVRPLIQQAVQEAIGRVSGRISEFSLEKTPQVVPQVVTELNGSGENLGDLPEMNSPAVDLPTQGLNDIAAYLQGVIEEMLIQGESGLKMTAWVQKKLKEIKPFIQEALEEAREQGGAGIILYADDGASGIDKPLNLENLQDIEGYNVLSSEDLIADTYNTDINSKNYGEIETYKVNFNNTEENYSNRTAKNNTIHASRVIAFHGRKVNKKLRRVNGGWGYSVIDRAFVPINNFIQGSNCIASSLQSFSQTVLFIHDMAKKIAAGKGQQVKEHVRTIAFLRHALGILALDGEHEKYEILSRNYANIEKVLEHLAQMAAGACDLPLNLLLNRTSSDALNSALVNNNTGGNNQFKQDWSDHVFARQGSDMMPQIEKDLIPILHACQANPFKGKEPEKWKVKRKQIFTESPEQQAKTKQILANAIALLVDRGILDTFEVAKALATGVDIFETIDLNRRLQELNQVSRLTTEQRQQILSKRANQNLPTNQSTKQPTREYESQQQASTQQGEQGQKKSSPQIQI